MNKPIRLLYAEDNPNDADLTKRHFAREAPEFQLEIIDTGKKCLELIQKKAFDILMLDYHLPDMDGIDVMRKLIRKGFPLPVVMVTGAGDEELVVQSLRAGALDYISKNTDYLTNLPVILKQVVAEYQHKKKMGKEIGPKQRHILHIEHLQLDIDRTLKHLSEAAPHFTTKAVQTSKEALHLLKTNHNFDLVLADLRMPDMNALELLRELKHHGVNLPFIVISGRGDEETAVATLKLGASDYIVKRANYLTQLPYAIENAIARYQLDVVNYKLLIDLEKLNNTLEQKVQDRTAKLEKEIFVRKQAEEALKTQMLRNEQILRTTMDGYILADTEGQLLDVNPAYCEIVGYSKEELLKMNIRELERKQTPEKIEQMVKQGYARFETMHKCKDGKIIDLEVSIVIMQSEEIPLVAAFVRDITERKFAEQQIRNERDKAESYLNIAAVMIVIVNAEQKVELINKQGCEILGYRESEIIDQNWFERFLPERNKEKVMGVYDKLMAGEIEPVEYYENSVVNRKGQERIIAWHNTVLRDTKDDIIGTLSSGEDITERKHAEEARRKSEERYRSLFDNANDSIYLIDPQTSKIIDCNKKASEMDGYSTEELKQMKAEDLHPIEERKYLPEKFKVIEEKGAESGISGFHHQRIDGRLVPIEVNAAMIEIGGEKFNLSIVRDITERQQAEEKLQQNLHEITSLNKLAQEVSSNISLKNVVTAAIAGVSETIQPDLVLIFLREGDELILQGFGPRDSKYKHKKSPIHRVGECLCGLTVSTNEAVYSTNISNDPRCTREECKKAGFHSFAALPLQSRGKALGVIGLASVKERDFHKQSTFLETLTNEIAIGLQNAIFYEELKHHSINLEKEIAERKRADKALKDSQKRLQTLSRRLLEVQETERRTIARELHDEIGQILTALKINLQTIPDQNDAVVLQKHSKENVHLVEQALQQARNLSLDLRPSILDDLGLIPALRWYLDRQSQRTWIAVELSANELKTSLPPELEIACFRIVQEALTNVARHANAKHVWVELQEEKNILQIVIRDDGVGFNVNTAHKRATSGASMGILGMEERVQLASGRIVIQSQPGKGTEIQVHFPLSKNKPAVQKSKGKVKS